MTFTHYVLLQALVLAIGTYVVWRIVLINRHEED